MKKLKIKNILSLMLVLILSLSILTFSSCSKLDYPEKGNPYGMYDESDRFEKVESKNLTEFVEAVPKSYDYYDVNVCQAVADSGMYEACYIDKDQDKCLCIGPVQ